MPEGGAGLRLDAVSLRGRHARLEPLDAADTAALWQAGQAPAIWRWSPEPIDSATAMRRYVDRALADRDAGVALPFTIRLQHSGTVVGSTRFGNVALADRRLEIGWTWLSPAVQRTPVNTECKYLLLRHAFETLELNRVELKTDALNEPSRAAMVRIGAVQEGVFRRHMVTASGRIRDTVYLSIIREEWPQVKARLDAMLERPFSFE